jgi:hypothetical protein
MEAENGPRSVYQRSGSAQRVVEDVNSALASLPPLLSPCCTPFEPTSADRDPDTIATLIIHAMASAGRAYHATPHVFELYERKQAVSAPLACLAALFHDIVYLHTDGGILPANAEALQSLGCSINVRPKGGERSRTDRDRGSERVCNG